MKTNPRSTTRSLVLAALFLALAFVLPMITGHVPQVGNMPVSYTHLDVYKRQRRGLRHPVQCWKADYRGR